MMIENKGTLFVEARIRDHMVHKAQMGHISCEKVSESKSYIFYLFYSTSDFIKLKFELEHQLSSKNLSFELLEDILEDVRSK